MTNEELKGVWLNHICAEGYNNKWTLHYLTDEEAKICYNALHARHEPQTDNDALEALECLEMVYQVHIEETLEEQLPDDDETIALARECRDIIRKALTRQTAEKESQ